MSKLDLTDEQRRLATEKAQELRDWLNSAEGKEQARSACQRSLEAAKEREALRQVDPKDLDKPVTC